MAQGDLYKLLRRISNAIEKDSDTLRAKMVGYTHDIEVNRDQIRDEILMQIQNNKLVTKERVQPARRLYGIATGLTREESAAAIKANLATTVGLSPGVVKVVEQQADKFVEDIITFKYAGYKIAKIAERGPITVIRVTPLKARAKTYDMIKNELFKKAKDRIKRLLATQGITLTQSQTENFFHIGHVTAVSEVNANRAVAGIRRNFSNISERYSVSDETSKQAIEYFKLSILSKFTSLGSPEFVKEFQTKVAIVRPESEASNLADSDYEKAILNTVRATLKKAMESNKDWANQKGSDSVMEIISKDLMETAAKRGAKVSGLKAKNTKSNSAELDTKKQTAKRKKVKVGSFGIEVDGIVPNKISAGISLTALIPIINQRLADVIRSKMGIGGRLVNRTGRFSESAQVISADGFGLTYSYQKDPYAVFEAQGARDPRPLIEQSIRQIAIGLTKQKFNLRSA